jgi:hypothetical protein
MSEAARTTMTRRALIAAVALLAAPCAPPVEGPRSTFVRVVDTDSDKAVSIVEDVRFDGHEARRIQPDTLRRLLLASGLLLPDDAERLAEPVSEELAGMSPSEYVRVTAWADDGVRRTFVWVSGGRLHLAYFRGDVELDRYEAPIPSETVATFTAPDAAPAAPTPTPAPTPAPIDTVDAGPTVVAQPTPAPTPAPKKRARRCPAIARKDATPISEETARRKLSELDTLRDKGLVDQGEYRCKRKEILARL